MGTLAALLLATPLFGFSLTPPGDLLDPADAGGRLRPAAFAAAPRLLFEPLAAPELGGAGAAPAAVDDDGADADEEGDAPAAAVEGDAEEETAEMSAPVESPAPAPAPAPPVPATATPLQFAGSGAAYAAEPADAAPTADGGAAAAARAARPGDRDALRRRHMTTGILTWVAMAATLAVGAVQYSDEYGAGEWSETRCGSGTALLGQTNCDTPYFHLMSALVTGSLYVGAFALSSQLGRDESMSDQRRSNRRLRTHRTLRWVHLAMLGAQIVEGIIFAAVSSNIDREDNFSTMQGLGAFHLAFGTATFGVLTAAGALML